jgi:hypothetical protein
MLSVNGAALPANLARMTDDALAGVDFSTARGAIVASFGGKKREKTAAAAVSSATATPAAARTNANAKAKSEVHVAGGWTRLAEAVCQLSSPSPLSSSSPSPLSSSSSSIAIKPFSFPCDYSQQQQQQQQRRDLYCFAGSLGDLTPPFLLQMQAAMQGRGPGYKQQHTQTHKQLQLQHKMVDKVPTKPRGDQRGIS